MTAFGIDVSTKRLGLARPDGSTVSVIPHAGASDNLRRLHELTSAVDAELRLFPEATLAMIEGYSLGSPGRLSLVRLGEAGGSIRLRCFERGLTVVEISPTSLKLAATGNAKASKEEMVDAAIARGGCPQNHDEADAWHLHDLGRRYLAGEPLPAAVALLAWPEKL